MSWILHDRMIAGEMEDRVCSKRYDDREERSNLDMFQISKDDFVFFFFPLQFVITQTSSSRRFFCYLTFLCRCHLQINYYTIEEIPLNM